MSNKEILDTLVVCGKLDRDEFDESLYEIDYSLEKFVKILNKFESNVLLYWINIMYSFYMITKDKEKIRKCCDDLYNLVVIYDKYFEKDEVTAMILGVRLDTVIMNKEFDNFEKVESVLRAKRKLDISLKANKGVFNIKYKNGVWKLVRVMGMNQLIKKDGSECIKDIGYIELFEDKLDIHKGWIYDIKISEDSVCLV